MIYCKNNENNNIDDINNFLKSWQLINAKNFT